MKTLQLDIINKSEDYSEYIRQSTGLYYKLYNHHELLEDKGFINECKKDFNLLNDVSVIRSITNEVLTKLKQKETIIKNKENELSDLYDKLDNCESFEKPKIISDISFLVRTKDKDICFGGKNLLRKNY